MSKKKRFKFKSSIALKRAHYTMLNAFDTVCQVSSNKRKNGDVFILFSMKNDTEYGKLMEHASKIRVKIEEIS